MKSKAKTSITRLALRLASQASISCLAHHRTSVLEAVRDLLRRHMVVQREASRLVKAVQRGWFGAARRIVCGGRCERETIHRSWEEYARVLEEFEGANQAAYRPAELLAELEELAGEFQTLEWDDEHLWVTTEPISLEGVQLGPFEIRLRLDRVGTPAGSHVFEIVALDPNPASSSEDVTHPHVSESCLCPGDAAAPIQLALEQARLTDFFQLVRSVLTTYNPHSAYVKLEEWDGMQCYECDACVSSDYACYCEGCEHDYCGDCSSSCGRCDAGLCCGCLDQCRGCGNRFCGSCLVACTRCRAQEFCESCLEEGLCESCSDAQSKEQSDENTNEQNETERKPESDPEVSAASASAAGTDADVHPQCVA